MLGLVTDSRSFYRYIVHKDEILKSRILLKKHFALVGIFVIFFAGVALGMSFFPDTTFRDAINSILAIGILTAICVGGWLAYDRLQLFRTFEPHLTISHEVSHRRVGNSYIHIAVKAILANHSKVKIELRKGFYRLQQVMPANGDGEIVDLYSQVFIRGEAEYLQWPTIEEIDRIWSEGELIVEPGEAHPETCEFIVSDAVESVIIYTYFFNPDYREGSSSAVGWFETTFFDLS